jgi:16S rRNA (adenine1518-N6/adenine1519-N6)-dimethyltransferase
LERILKHLARKRFGQHFLVDQGVIDEIIYAISPKPEDSVVEIGPGMGAMTQPLVAQLGRLCVVELDKDLVAQLQRQPKLRVISADVLKVDFKHLLDSVYPGAKELRVVGNLPYNISTPILFHLLSFVDIIKDQHFMLQKEVVERMVAKPSSAAYGRLSVMLQWRYEMDSILDVEPDSFDPPPRVTSAVVRMRPKQEFADIAFNVFQSVVQVAFSQRRKLLRHTLGHWLEERQFEGNFELKRRAEEVSVQEYIELATLVHNQIGGVNATD